MIRVVNSAFAVETFLEGTRTDAERIAEMLGKGEFLVAESPGPQLVACVFTQSRGDRGYLGMLAVDPSAQGRGIGRAMVGAAEAHCRRAGCLRMELSVLSLRPELLPFYKRLGYVETGREEFVPSRPLKAGIECHKILMSKSL